MPSRRRTTPLVIAVLTLTGFCRPFCSASEPPSAVDGIAIEKVDVGIGGAYKVGKWTPLKLHLKAAEPYESVSVEVETSDPYGHRTVVPHEFPIPAAGLHVRTALFRPGNLEPAVRVRVNRGKDRFHRRQYDLRVGQAGRSNLGRGLMQSAVLLATLGRPAGFRELAEAIEEVHLVELTAPNDLPSHVLGYDALDVLVLGGSPRLTAEQGRAIREWVRSGGHLLVAADRFAAKSSSDDVLREWLETVVPVSGTTTARELGGLENFSGRTEPVSLPFEGIRVAEIDPDIQGKVLVRESHGPLVVRVAAGFGRVTFVGIDLAGEVIADWEPLTDVLAKLIGTTEQVSSERRPRRRGRLSHGGVSDLATQLQVSLGHAVGRGPVSLWTAMGFLLVYLAIIGPLDYFLVGRVFRKPRLTWLTFPIIVAAASFLAAWTADRTKPSELQAAQIDLVDIDAGASASGRQTARLRSWLSVYSPEHRRYRAVIKSSAVMRRSRPTAAASKASFRVGWAAVPEDSFGGMYRSGGLELGRTVYEFFPGSLGVENLPISTASTRMVVGEHRAELDTLVESDFRQKGVGRLTGTLVHYLPGPIEDWMLAYGPRVYYPAVDPRDGKPVAIAPGRPWSTDDRFVRPRELHGYLTGTRSTVARQRGAGGQSEPRLVQTEYDPLAREPGRIMRMITFHDEAGGAAYTHLHNDSFRSLELSPLLDLNRAVLFGRIRAAAARLELDGRTVDPRRHWTFVRIVLPVRPEE